jgi:hypothetical protein
LPAIEASERDNTQDWIVPRGAVPTVDELEARIDEALAIALASEDGVHEVGEMALDAARQARRAAEAAEESAQAAAAIGSATRAALTAAASAPQRAAAREPVAAGPVSDSGLSLSGESSESSPPAGGGGVGQPPGEETAIAREVVIDPLARFNARADAIAARLRKLVRVPV